MMTDKEKIAVLEAKLARVKRYLDSIVPDDSVSALWCILDGDTGIVSDTKPPLVLESEDSK